MNEAAVARYYGRILGMLAGLFALLQALVSISSARANMQLIRALQELVANGAPQTLIDFLRALAPGFDMLGDLVPTLIATYASMVITGVIMLGFAFYAGRVTAQELGRHTGASAGFWVALVSGAIWLGISALGAIVLRADGTLSGVLTSGAGDRLFPQLFWLLLQELPLALLGLGFGALAGLIGAHTARIAPRAQPLAAPRIAGQYIAGQSPAMPSHFQPYPAQPYPPMSAPAYPPAPEFYQTPRDPQQQG